MTNKTTNHLLASIACILVQDAMRISLEGLKGDGLYEIAVGAALACSITLLRFTGITCLGVGLHRLIEGKQ